MKRKNFLQKLILYFALLSFLAGAIAFTSCKKEEPLPDCYIYKFGMVTIENATGYDLFVDVTFDNYDEYDTRLLFPNQSHTYEEIPAGPVDIWASFDEIEWTWEEDNLSACEDMTFTWYLDGKKSSEKTLRLKVKRGDKEIELNPVIKPKNI